MQPLINQNARPLQSYEYPKALRLQILAPHPDDVDAIGDCWYITLVKKGLLAHV
jgi:hypothetical protein